MKRGCAMEIASMLLLAACTYPASSYGKNGQQRNLVENPGFEILNEDQTTAAGWRQESPRKEIAPVFGLDSRVVHSGKYAAKLSSRGSPGTFGFWATTVDGIESPDRSPLNVSPTAITVEGSKFLGIKAYLIECFFKSQDVDSVEKNVWIRVKWNDSEGQELFKEYVYPSHMDGDWHRATKVLVAPKEAASLDLELVLQWTKTGSVWWDDVTVREVGPPRTGRKVRIATLHYIPPDGSTPEKNRQFYAEKVEQAGKAGADIVCLGESITVVSTDKKYVDVAEVVPGPTSELLGQVARKHNLYVVVGIYEREGALVYNTALLIDRNGRVAGRYRKTHLPETEISGGITPSDEYPVFKTDFGVIGLQICYDNFFPEVARSLALNGAEIIFTPIYGDPRQENYAWDIVARARAIDNAVYFVASTYTPTRRSLIVDPGGQILADTKGKEGIVMAEIDLDHRTFERWLSVSGFGEWRNLFPKERRRDTYTPLVTDVPGEAGGVRYRGNASQ
ncbi:MAG: carbon-nitrogen hydrolase family protein [Acidobacteriota bacterium]